MSVFVLLQKEGMDVRLEILSNWGHSSQVGLTEVQLLQSSGSLLPVPSTGVSVQGAHSPSGPPSILFNGKAKVRRTSSTHLCDVVFEQKTVSFCCVLCFLSYLITLNPSAGMGLEFARPQDYPLIPHFCLLSCCSA